MVADMAAGLTSEDTCGEGAKASGKVGGPSQDFGGLRILGLLRSSDVKISLLGFEK